MKRSEWRMRALKRAALATYGPVCQLCGEAIDLSLRYPHPLSYSTDHIVTVNAAPERMYDVTNVWPAHLTCNSRRGQAPPPDPPTQRTALTW